MKKGIIMEVDERFLTMLTPEGEFLKAPNQKQDYEIGQEIAFIPVKNVQKNKSMFLSFFPAKALIAAVLALFVAAATFLPSFNEEEVYAYMSIDVNPSIELAVNDKLEVVKIKAFNYEGELIVSQLSNWKRLDVSIVTTDIIKEIKKQGFFQKHNSVLISTVYDSGKGISDNFSKELLANIEEIEEKIVQDNLQVTVIEATKEEREAAHKQGITAGVYKEKLPLTENIDINLDQQNEGKTSESENKTKHQQDAIVVPKNTKQLDKEKNTHVQRKEKNENKNGVKNNKGKDQNVKQIEKNKQTKDKDKDKSKDKDKDKDKSKDKEKNKAQDKDSDNNSKTDEIISNNMKVLPNHTKEEKGKSKTPKEKEEKSKFKQKEKKAQENGEEKLKTKYHKEDEQKGKRNNKEEKTKKQNKENNKDNNNKKKV